MTSRSSRSTGPRGPRALGIICTLGTLWFSSSALADELSATLGEAVREVSHAVDVRVVDGTAVYKVRRSFANAGKRHDEASLRIDLPLGAAVTGLRIRALRRWYDGELMEAERAAELYRELTGMGPHTPRDPALLQWVTPEQAHLQVFPVPPGRTATVEYTLTAPTRYLNGRHLFSYPKPEEAVDLARAVLRVFPQRPTATIKVDGRTTARTQPMVLESPKTEEWIADQSLDESATHVVSQLKVEAAGRPRSIEVDLDIRHTFRGDLRVQLVTPWGRWQTLHDRAGGGKNDLRGTFKVPVKVADRARPVKGTWRLVISDHAARDVGSLTRWSLRFKLDKGKRQLKLAAADLPLFLPDAPSGDGSEGHAMIQVSPSRIRTVAARLGRVVAAGDKQFLRLEVEAAPMLRPMPRQPRVVFVVDASHSIAPRGVGAQLEVMRSFLRHVPDARVEVVLYRRRATRLFGELIATDKLEAAIKAAREAKKLACGNGSALDRGFLLAARVLRSQRGDRYIVMASDGLLRSSWRNKAALAGTVRLPARTVAHVVIPEIDGEDHVSERRNDEHELSPLAAAHGGVLLQISGLPTPNSGTPGAPRASTKELDRATLGLVRPLRIDGFDVLGVSKDQLESLPEALEEGAGFREMLKLKRAPARVVLRGKIWAKPFRRIVRVSKAFSRVTAAYLFSHDMHEELTKAEMLKVARMGRAVSPVTSYLAIEPGVRPSTAGIDRLGTLGTGGGGGSGAGYGRGVGRLGRRIPPNLSKLLVKGIARCVAKHRPSPGWSAHLTVETTKDEVVDVTLNNPSTPMRRCLVEEVWAVRLTKKAFDQERESFDLQLP